MKRRASAAASRETRPSCVACVPGTRHRSLPARSPIGRGASPSLPAVECYQAVAYEVTASPHPHPVTSAARSTAATRLPDHHDGAREVDRARRSASIRSDGAAVCSSFPISPPASVPRTSRPAGARTSHSASAHTRRRIPRSCITATRSLSPPSRPARAPPRCSTTYGDEPGATVLPPNAAAADQGGNLHLPHHGPRALERLTYAHGVRIGQFGNDHLARLPVSRETHLNPSFLEATISRKAEPTTTTSLAN